MAQESINNYKYIIVPKKYDFLKSEDKYQLNSLTKFLFNKEGFVTLFDNDRKPEELANSPCLGLLAKVINHSGMFTTKLQIELINCRNEKVLLSKEGRSKQKDYKKTYQEALRNAFKSISALDYKYKPIEASIAINEKIIDTKKPITTVNKKVSSVPVEVSEKPIEIKKESTIVKTEVSEKHHNDVKVKKEEALTNLLYAQSTDMGYQLVDKTPKVVYTLLRSGNANLFFLKNKTGIIFKEGSNWFVEYYNGDILVKEKLQIKF